MICKICSSETFALADSLILGRHSATWQKCTQCGLVFPAEVTWLQEAYSSAITSSDIGYVYRNLRMASVTAAVIDNLHPNGGTFCDFGSGYGMLVRLMRDRGYDFHGHEPYCTNLFAQTFEAKNGTTYDLVTAFEVFEHFLSPRDETLKALQFSSTILFSTSLLPEPTPMPSEWWYYGLEHGQHVSLYTVRSLTELGNRFGLSYTHLGGDMHVFHSPTDQRFRNAHAMLHPKASLPARVFQKLFPMPKPNRTSFLMTDFAQIRHKLSN